MRASSPFSWMALAASVACACAPADEGPRLGFAIQRLDGPGLPAEVTELRLRYRVGGAREKVLTARVSELRSEAGRRRLSLDLPADTPVRVRIEGLVEGGDTGFVGSVGPVTLSLGEELKKAVVLSPAGESQPVAGEAPSPRFLHTATALADGRVLIAGGFSKPTPETCPDALPRPGRCFRVIAQDDAWLFDADSLRFVELPDGLLEARAGHSATLLPDGRVLLAGGAREALLVLWDDAPLVPHFVARDGQGKATQSASYELFDPNLPEELASDDGVRGTFVGSAHDPSTPGPLLVPRFLHAAAESVGSPGQVLLAAGLGSRRSSRSYEVFDLRRPGGYGVYEHSLGELALERTGPVALGFLRGAASDSIWIFGGAVARSNAELAEVWTRASSAGQGAVLPASEESAFPQPEGVEEDATPLPAYASSRSLAARFLGLEKALVLPALPATCDADGTPVFSETSVLAEAAFCTSAEPLRTGFVLDAATGHATPYATAHAHLLGAIAELDDGSIVVSGGLSDLAADTPSQFVEHIALEEADKAPRNLAALPMLSPRSLHSTTGLPEGGVLSFGGLHFASGKPQLVDAPEVLRW